VSGAALRSLAMLAAAVAVIAAIPALAQSIHPFRKLSKLRMITARRRRQKSQASRIISWTAARRTGAVCVAKRPGTTTPGTRSSGVGLGPQLWYVSFGAELRGSCGVYRNYNWGSGLQDRNGYYLKRLIGHADFHLGRPVRVFASG
jgi:hypothetical protein